MSDYIELGRLFTDYDESNQGENDSTPFVDYLYSAKSWGQILEGRCTVVIAEAGTGKSEEFRQRARKLLAEGKPAFYAALDLLAKLPTLRSSLTIGETCFDSWLAGSEHGYFFLDAVDEAKLVDPREFAVAITNFASAVEGAKGRYSLVVSTRPHAWQANADRTMLAERLDLKLTAEHATDKSPAEERQDIEGVDESVETSETKKVQPVSIVRLAGLSRQQVQTFAKAKGVSNPNDFIAAIEVANAEVFATRPADLPGLIALWRQDGKIGKYSDVVRYNVEMKLAEQNPAHKGRGIASEHAKLGAQALGAAASLSGQISFLLPDEDIAEKIRSSSIDPGSVLQGWSSEEIRALLSTALFDESLYGTVRFHHRTAREYLCACWLARLLDRKKSRRQIEELLFARPYGIERLVVRPAMKPIAAWLALTDQDIRDKVMNADPRVLLEHGDASSLDIGTRSSLLKLVADRYSDRKHTPIRMDVREVRRLTDKRLSVTLKQLFTTHRTHEDVRHLLLRIVREGNIDGFTAEALAFLADASMDNWTRSLSIQVITATGSVSEKKRVAGMLLKAPAAFPRDVVGQGLEALVPAYISWKELVQMLAAVPANQDYSSDHLNFELGPLLGRIDSPQGRLNIIGDLRTLLSTAPLHDPNLTRISIKYHWLLTAAGELACNIARTDRGSWSNDALLSVLSMCQQGDHLRRYLGDVHRQSSKVLAETPDLRHLLFWHEVEQERALGQGPVIHWWKVSHLPSLRQFDDADLDNFISAIRERNSPDDKKTALSAAFSAWSQTGRAAEKLDELRAATAGNAVLSQELDTLVAPAPPDAATQQTVAEHRKLDRDGTQERRKRNEARKAWIQRLKVAPSQVGSLSIAGEGKVLNYTLGLLDEVRKSDKRNTVWTVTNWQSLIPDFDVAVASSFRDFCKQFWRAFWPPLRSEYAGAEHSTPTTIVLGLSGIAMDWDHCGTWATSLSPREAEQAARYAIWELNGFPDWFTGLHEAHPAVVDRVLLAEIRWELETPTEGSRSYVLSRLRWSNKALGRHVSDQIAALIVACDQPTDYALRDAIIVILAGSQLPAQGFLNAARVRGYQESGNRALWIAVLLALEGSSGLEALNGWLADAASDGDRARRVLAVLDEMFSDERTSVATAHKAFATVPILGALLTLLYDLPAKTEGEDSDDGGYRSRSSSGGRRDFLQELLFNIPGRTTFDALARLASKAPERRDYLLSLAERRAEQDSELTSWHPSDVHLFSSDIERSPRTEAELFSLTLSRLDDLKQEYEEGDESEASLLRKVSNEVELRKVIANRLKLAARSSYTTGSEEELADGKRTDIRIHHPAVENRIPIEIKIAGQWRLAELAERLKNQLVGQYMRESSHGIFLLVNRGAANDQKKWRVNGKLSGLVELVTWLQKQAHEHQRKNSAVVRLEVIAIDLLRLGMAGAAPKVPKAKTKVVTSAKRIVKVRKPVNKMKLQNRAPSRKR